VESLTLTRVRDSITPEQRAELEKTPPVGHGAWSQTDMLLALIADRVAEQTWVLGEWKTRPPAPKPLPRPGIDGPARRRPGSLDAARAAVSERTRLVAEALRRGEAPPAIN
jgi:hypothetical protein